MGCERALGVLAGTSLDNDGAPVCLADGCRFGYYVGVIPLIGIVSAAQASFSKNYALIFAAAGLLFVLSILPVLFVHELPAANGEKILSLGEFLPAL